MVSLYFRSNCVIKLNTVLPPYWLFSLLFDRTKGSVINQNSNIIIVIPVIVIIILVTLCACCLMQTFLANFLLSHDCIIQLFPLGTPNLMLIKSTDKYNSTGACQI